MVANYYQPEEAEFGLDLNITTVPEGADALDVEEPPRVIGQEPRTATPDVTSQIEEKLRQEKARQDDASEKMKKAGFFHRMVRSVSSPRVVKE